jgi:electron transport complex protein RnfB
MGIISAVVLVTLVGAVGAVILVVAAKFMAVEEDPRIAEVTACLAGANCGGCGYAGCADYAKAVVTKGEPCDKCAPGGAAAAAAVAKIMGVDAGAMLPKKAFVGCQGSTQNCKPKYDYKGISTCAAAAKLYGGPKACQYACIGLGDCVKACKFDAISVKDGVATVDPDKCTGCGACKAACPKSVIFLSSMVQKPVVMCSNHEKGPVAMKECNTACIACGICEKNCPTQAIHVTNFVARIDYDKCIGCNTCMEKCPKKIISYPLTNER